MLIAPEGNFAMELKRMQLGRSPYKVATLPGSENQSFARESLEGDLLDLAAALKLAKVPQENAEQILREHRQERAALCEWIEDDSHPPMPLIKLVPGLPDEFADYLEGLIAWNKSQADRAAARPFWEKLLARPPEERRFKSTWAAFMLGRSWESEDPVKAGEYFAKVRQLANEGCYDTLGLAAASLGLEARTALKRNACRQAIELYLQQEAAGDAGAIASLRIAAAAALQASPQELIALARNPRTQRVVTAYIVSRGAVGITGEESSENYSSESRVNAGTVAWVSAVQQAGVQDAESAEKLALAAYQGGSFDWAQWWISKAPKRPVSQWLQAKLWFRAGELEKAAELLTKLTRSFPAGPQGTNEFLADALKDTLMVEDHDVPTQILGELGVIRLAQGRYVQALEALLQGGFWRDAAYIAERVLTVDELKTFVDSNWPAVSAEQSESEREQFGTESLCPARQRDNIRYLLARRLARIYRSAEAREYMPERWVTSFDAYLTRLAEGWNLSIPQEQRAQGFLRAAHLARSNGMEFFGTELEPDWHIFDGEFSEESTSQARATSTAAQILKVSGDESNRAAQHAPNPDTRFHYRYVAARLALEAANLMPNDSEETAMALWTAGSWLKGRDPETADIFYKALVRRNPHTELGAEAERRRWFPPLDDDGKVIHKQERPLPVPVVETVSNELEIAVNESGTSEEPPMPETDSALEPRVTLPEPDSATNDGGLEYEHGFTYIVHKGDTLARIAQACNLAGLQITIKDILDANDNLNPAKMLIGQKIVIPLPETTTEQPAVNPPAETEQ